MKTAIIGMGNIGTRLAKNLVQGGEHVILADRDPAKAKAMATELGSKAKAATLDEALKEADAIAFTVWFDATRELVTKHRKELEGKIVIDPSNPIAPDGKGGFKKTIGENESAGQIIAGLLPPTAKLVKAFGTLAAETLAKGANRKPERAVLFYASDDEHAGKAVAKLITASGFEAVRVGGIDKSMRIEAFGDLHEFGKLGKLVSLTEAKAAL